MNFITNKIQAGFAVISIIIIIVQILFFTTFAFQKNVILWIILPIILMLIIFFIENHIKKGKDIIQLLSILLSVGIILFLQLGVCTYIILTNFSIKNLTPDKDIKNINEYTIIMKKINSNLTKHFPKNIPQQAKNQQFYCSGNSYFGGRIVYLMFDVNKDYISTELKKYKFLFTEGPFNDKKQYKYTYPRSFIFDNLLKDMQINGYKLYVIGNNLNTKNCHDSCEYGIAVNHKTNIIIYYASNPD